VYAALLAVATKSFVPVTRMVSCGVLGVGLAAPRLLPILEVLRHYPRLIDSTETMGLGDFVQMLVSRQQSPSTVQLSEWGWHEWGLYIGWIPLVAIALGVVATRGTREQQLRILGLFLLSLAFGRFFEYAPWPLLHLLPVFSSQHVPSRWMVPALLVLACVAASGGERLLRRAGSARALAEIIALVGVAFLAADVSRVARDSLAHTFNRPPPTIKDPLVEFRTERHVPPALDYDPGEWGPSTFSALLANMGSLDCNSFAGFTNYTRDRNGHAPGLGAHAVGDAAYHGEVYVAEGSGTANVVGWSPNAVEVRVTGARPGDHLVLNQNWDPGWTANGASAPAWQDTVSAVLVTGSDTVRFRYRPKTFFWGVLVFLASAAYVARPWLGAAAQKLRRRRLAARLFTNRSRETE
jgi:hypothetical protein